MLIKSGYYKSAYKYEADQVKEINVLYLAW